MGNCCLKALYISNILHHYAIYNNGKNYTTTIHLDHESRYNKANILDILWKIIFFWG